ncbi:hypothetical protein [Antrihabitans spumae]|uniref:Uncharacterized protein n=1 Tax=Antrihabitans spumae TaxID=3373370 RepID=A0ABW7K8I1_9NOCA
MRHYSLDDWDEGVVLAALGEWFQALDIPMPGRIVVDLKPDSGNLNDGPGTVSLLDELKRRMTGYASADLALWGVAYEHLRVSRERIGRDQLGLLVPSHLAHVAAALRKGESALDLRALAANMLTAFTNGLLGVSVGPDAVHLVRRPAMHRIGGRLHRVDGPALEWADGSRSFFLRGTQFTEAEHGMASSRSYTAADAVAIRNHWKRAAAIAMLMPEEKLRALDASLPGEWEVDEQHKWAPTPQIGTAAATCVLWRSPAALRPMSEAFELVETIAHEVGLWRHVLRCRCCGGKYFFQFYELEDDWDHDNEYYCTWVPYETDAELARIVTDQSKDLAEYTPRLCGYYRLLDGHDNVYCLGANPTLHWVVLPHVPG